MHVYRSSNEEMIPQYTATIARMVQVCSCADLCQVLSIFYKRRLKWSDYFIFFQKQSQQEAHGPHRSPEKTVLINKHIRLSQNVD